VNPPIETPDHAELAPAVSWTNPDAPGAERGTRSQDITIGTNRANVYVGATGGLSKSRSAPHASRAISEATIPLPPMRKHRWKEAGLGKRLLWHYQC